MATEGRKAEGTTCIGTVVFLNKKNPNGPAWSRIRTEYQTYVRKKKGQLFTCYLLIGRTIPQKES